MPAGVPEGPEGEAFFVPPDPLPVDEPGTVIWAQPFAAFEDADGYRVLFRSQDPGGDTVAVSGMVFLPTEPPPDGTRPLAVSASSRGSIADACTASHDPTYERGNAEVGLWSERVNAQVLLRHGYAVVVPDYQGFGTPGPSPFLAGPSAGRNVLDALRVLRTFVGPEAGDAVAVGDTQGAAAVLFAAELAPTYAPDVDLIGVVATQPLAELATLAPGASASPAFGYYLLALSGLAVDDPDLPLASVLTPTGLEAAAQYETTCGQEVTDALSRQDPGVYIRKPGETPSATRDTLEANCPARPPPMSRSGSCTAARSNCRPWSSANCSAPATAASARATPPWRSTTATAAGQLRRRGRHHPLAAGPPRRPSRAVDGVPLKPRTFTIWEPAAFPLAAGPAFFAGTPLTARAASRRSSRSSFAVVPATVASRRLTRARVSSKISAFAAVFALVALARPRDASAVTRSAPRRR